MKNLFKVSLLLVITTFIFSCGGGTPENPKDVAKEFLTALAKKDFDRAKELGTETTVQTLTLIEGMAESIPDMKTDDSKEEMDKVNKIEWGETEIDGDKAVVHYKSVDGEEKLDLVKVKGDWKVDMKKEG